ncbi:hypothetical protein [Candidatus Magnetomonas plexicatena]|uniref:hypothetical protein n=1 Tax=Candidatus Magnetomonas plexicatena TaxID=2552947 RepID=UPI0011050040|nr:hypothetical protein E2O03_011370 [Nitrospirales bacterium LBB_01]
MKKVVVLAVVLVFALSTVAMAGFEKCQGCHNGKVSPTKEKLLEKFKTADAFIQGAKAAKSPMMNAAKANEADLKAAAAELGLK